MGNDDEKKKVKRSRQYLGKEGQKGHVLEDLSKRQWSVFTSLIDAQHCNFANKWNSRLVLLITAGHLNGVGLALKPAKPVFVLKRKHNTHIGQVHAVLPGLFCVLLQ